MSALALTFRIFRRDTLVREETLRQGVIKIGKVASAHLRLDDDSVSRMHAILEVDTAGHVDVIDLGSTRGTFINGHKINKARLESGDAIGIGDLRVEVAIQRTDAVLAAPLVAVATPPAARVPAVVPPTVAARVPVAAPARLAVPFSTAVADNDVISAKAIEVAAMLGDSVVGVKHCIDPKSGKVSPRTWGLFAAGVTCVVASAIAFGASVRTAAFNKGGYEYTTRVLHKPAYAFRPVPVDPALDWIAFGGAALGLSTLIAGLARLRGERRTPYYRIGTAPGVELALESSPSPSFPLVAPSADGEDFVFNYGAGIEGELVLDGQTTTLAELAASGRARPSATTAGAIELPIPARARIRARAGQIAFVVSAVPQPRRQPLSLLGAFESRSAKYFAGSLAVHLGLLVLLQQLPGDDSAAAIELDDRSDVGVSIKDSAKETPPDEIQPDTGDTTGAAQGTESNKMALDPGAAGNPSSTAVDHHLTVKDNQRDPALAREDAIEQARVAGILGSLSSADNFRSLTSAADISSGFDDANLYGALIGADAGEAHGSFGGALVGFGRGGGCTQEPCGLIGTGSRYNTIGSGRHAGGGWGPGGGDGPHMRRPSFEVPRPVLGTPTGVGDLDRATIRRYINRNIEKIRYCYERELLAHPAISGEVLVQFFITPSGAVNGSAGRGFDANVATCVAGVVGNIEFPRPSGGGVQVNYPFTFHAPAR